MRVQEGAGHWYCCRHLLGARWSTAVGWGRHSAAVAVSKLKARASSAKSAPLSNTKQCAAPSKERQNVHHNGPGLANAASSLPTGANPLLPLGALGLLPPLPMLPPRKAAERILGYPNRGSRHIGSYSFCQHKLSSPPSLCCTTLCHCKFAKAPWDADVRRSHDTFADMTEQSYPVASCSKRKC
jgi:hypothetical protein